MGRRKKYHTDEERKEANRRKVKEYYWRNKDEVDRRAKEYYWRKKKFKLYEKEIQEKEKELNREMTNDEKLQFIEDLKIDSGK